MAKVVVTGHTSSTAQAYKRVLDALASLQQEIALIDGSVDGIYPDVSDDRFVDLYMRTAQHVNDMANCADAIAEGLRAAAAALGARGGRT